MPLCVDLTYEIVTPLFMSGVDQTLPDLRVPSIRGAVRAWYRGIDPRFVTHEPHTFGAADHRMNADDEDGFSQQSPFLLRVVQPPDGTPFTLDRNAYRRFDVGHPPHRTNGILYTGFSLLDRFNTRSAFPASSRQQRRTFVLRLVFPRPDQVKTPGGHIDPAPYYRILGAFWALGHLGGLGSRCNRGWGSVQLTAVQGLGAKVPDRVREVITSLQPASTTSTAAWLNDVARTLGTLRMQLGAHRDGHALATPNLGPGAQLCLARNASPEWDAALELMGATLQAFRRDVFLDRREVLGHLLQHQSSTRARQAAVSLTAAPRRVSFGLPLTFRYGIVPKRAAELGLTGLQPDTLELVPDDTSRHPGLLRLRVVRLAQGYHALAVRLQGDPPGSAIRDDLHASATPPARITGKVGHKNHLTGDRTGSLQFTPDPDGGVDHFVRYLTPHTIPYTVPP